MVTIRLSRGGSKKNPFYQIVVADIRAKRDGRYIERLGFFNPLAKGGEIELRVDRQRADYWLERGAQPTDRVKQLLKQAAREESATAVAA
ncbi:30S ribosomal protein S16 [Thiocapsa rosea]|uniref:Small ribosomal subunit protein bS16 n=1 Tax=Thiocapsa rosea TaxID=69360 RepID=A0A495VBU7_9GAMM|nr:30S ribosomal protein S16 [Thiocapsa rosea]RKT46866.1 SSU ribosomal protein S16P [Thiocapsa rosea]